MVAAGGGEIVNISSDAWRAGSIVETVNAAAKGGLIAFTKSLARELARHRINVNCICPGPTDTPFFQRQPGRTKEGADPGHPVPPHRSADRDCPRPVLSERMLGLHHRPGAERQRRTDDGGLSGAPSRVAAALRDRGIPL